MNASAVANIAVVAITGTANNSCHVTGRPYHASSATKTTLPTSRSNSAAAT